MGTSTIRYKGFNVLARPYQLHGSKHWTVELEIRRRGRKRPFSSKERFETEEEADAHCSGLARQIIDGNVAGWSVDHLRGQTTGWSGNGKSFRQLFVAGGVILGLGAFVLLRGPSFSSRHQEPTIGDVEVTATQTQSIPPWVAAVGALVGVALIVAGTRQRA